MMALSGVRSSWLMLARNWVLARLATVGRFLGRRRLSSRAGELGDVGRGAAEALEAAIALVEDRRGGHQEQLAAAVRCPSASNGRSRNGERRSTGAGAGLAQRARAHHHGQAGSCRYSSCGERPSTLFTRCGDHVQVEAGIGLPHPVGGEADEIHVALDHSGRRRSTPMPGRRRLSRPPKPFSEPSLSNSGTRRERRTAPVGR